MKLYIKTFGCQMNMYDSARIRDTLAILGYTETDSPEEADIILLNTCHIREKASEKLFSEIGRLVKFKKEHTLMIVAGCVVQADGEELLKRAHAVDIAVGPQSYHKLPELITKYNRKKGRIAVTDFPAESKFDYLPPIQAIGASAFLAVQEGCDHFCSYCVVPYTRGCEYSRSATEIMDEARQLVKTGAKEIMLLGQNVNGWHGEGARDLGDIIRMIADIDGLERIRYTTSYPSEMTENIITAHRDVPKLMPYIHLPIQSGSNAVLKAMNRQYDRDGYLRISERFRAVRPDIAISSDFIVGFPGETDKDFEDTLDLVQRVGYASSFSFKFSARPGTPASIMKNQIREEVKTERLIRLQDLLLSQQKQFNVNTVGKELDILLIENGKEKGQISGYTPYLQNTHIAADESLLGQIVRVKIESATATSLGGRLVKA
ncbi:MAG: tRNA (N6-isopentenyl adenosine(37)-C2)-methylthiotransferase MiaB [Alphaproteobacteria bacterium]|nr:tRNA (N6-isopentenyl adenosine(37)-C2)-methylthiotransferase MiaB [Alphaproteobacteria bacterium]